jgi:hypothetical protein
MMHETSITKGGYEVAKLNSRNWSTFSLEYPRRAIFLSKGDKTGKILSTRKDIPHLVPQITEEPFSLIENVDRRDVVYYRAVAEARSIQKQKTLIIADLEGHMDSLVGSQIRSNSDYQRLMEEDDLLGFWLLMEKIGSGASSASIHHALKDLIQITQAKSGSYVQYKANFFDAVEKLQNLYFLIHKSKDSFVGIFSMQLDTFFIMGLDRKQFKDHLVVIESSSVWPKYTVLAVELDNADLNYRFRRDEEEASNGKAVAFAVKDGNNNRSNTRNNFKKFNGPLKCIDCGELGYKKFDCPNCKHKYNSKPESNNNKSDSNNHQVDKDSNKLQSKKAALKKMSAAVTSEEKSRVVNTHVKSSSSNAIVTDEDYSYNSSDSGIEGKDIFILDTGCTERNITNNENILNNILPTNIRIEGVVGPEFSANKEGTISGIKGKTVLLKNFNVNLISVLKQIENGGSFEGNNKRLKIKDSTGNTVMIS